MADYAFHIEGENEAAVTVYVLDWQYPRTQHDYWADNWLRVLVDIHVPGYATHFGGSFLRNDELEHFLSELKQMHATLKGKSALWTLEGVIDLQAEIDTRGQIHWTGKTNPWTGDIKSGEFTLENDQSFLPGLIRELDIILEAFPIRGKRPESRRP